MQCDTRTPLIERPGLILTMVLIVAVAWVLALSIISSTDRHHPVAGCPDSGHMGMASGGVGAQGIGAQNVRDVLNVNRSLPSHFPPSGSWGEGAVSIRRPA